MDTTFKHIIANKKISHILIKFLTPTEIKSLCINKLFLNHFLFIFDQFVLDISKGNESLPIPILLP